MVLCAGLQVLEWLKYTITIYMCTLKVLQMLLYTIKHYLHGYEVII